MTSLTFCPAIYNVSLGTYLFLPVHNFEWSPTPTWKNETAEILGANGELILGQKKGSTQFSVSFQIVGYEGDGPYTRDTAISNSGAEAIRAAIEEALDGIFHLYRFSGQRYENCLCDSAPFKFHRPDFLLDFSFTARATNPNPVACAAIGETNPYDSLIHGTTGTTGGGGIVPVSTRSSTIFTCSFPGLSGVTMAGSEVALTMPAAGVLWRIKRLSVTGVSQVFGTGTTTVKVSSTGVGVAGDTMSLSITQAARAGSTTTGSFTILGGSTLYLYQTAGGVHGDVQVAVEYEVA